MADGGKTRGGARPGAGRKSKADEEDLRRRLGKACKDGRKDRLDELFGKLFEDCLSESFRTRHASMKLFLAYLYGKPAQRVILEGDKEDEPKQKIDLSQLNGEELEILERAGQILARARGGQGGEGPA